MRVRATATTTSETNAVGVVELECTPHGLVVGLLGVGAAQEGYAPAALVTGTRLCVPWAGVRRARVDEHCLYLHFEHEHLPHDRLALTSFTTGHFIAPEELRKRRLILRVAALGAAAIASLAAATILPQLSNHVAGGAVLLVGILAALCVFGVGLIIDQRLVGRGPGAEAVRAAFIAELGAYLPALELADEGSPSLVRTWTRRRLPNLAGVLPRTTAAVSITLAAGLVTALVSTQRLLSAPSEDAPVAALSKAAATDVEVPLESPATSRAEPTSGAAAAPSRAQPTTPTSSVDGDAATMGAPCFCDRAASVLWAEPIPKLSVLILEDREIPRRTHVRTHLEVAIVNNGDESLENITLNVQFFEGEGKAKKPTKHRPLFFEGPLGAGRAIKWETEARGTSWAIEAPFVGELGVDGQGAAPPAAFHALLAANHRPVRLHAARMLSFLGDPKAREAALGLQDALRTAEAPYLRRLLATTGDIRVCDVQITGSGSSRLAEACVFNGSDQEQGGLGIQVVAQEGAFNPDRPVASPPQRLAETKRPLPRPLAAHAGTRVTVAFDLGAIDAVNASAFEITAGAHDLLE